MLAVTMFAGTSHTLVNQGTIANDAKKDDSNCWGTVNNGGTNRGYAMIAGLTVRSR
jgi:hypothetical protein